MTELRCGTCGQKADDETMNELETKLEKCLGFIKELSAPTISESELYKLESLDGSDALDDYENLCSDSIEYIHWHHDYYCSIYSRDIDMTNHNKWYVFSRIKCWFGRHKYFVLRQLSRQSRLICCARCKRLFAMNDDVEVILPWDADFEQMYIDLGKFSNDQP